MANIADSYQFANSAIYTVSKDSAYLGLADPEFTVDLWTK